MNVTSQLTPIEARLIKIEELCEEDQLELVCSACGYKLVMTSAQAKSVARPYRSMSDFGKMSGCGYCRNMGLDVRLKRYHAGA